MTDEPVYTGWLPLQLSGDIELARTYEREGRRVLGKLLSVHGVNERIAAGEPGGFYKKSVVMPDGTRITASTNNGQQLLRIDTPRKQAERPVPRHHASAEGHAEGVVVRHEEGREAPPVQPPLPVPPTRELEDEPEEEPKEEGTEYLWVGVRYTTPNVPWYVMNAFLIEPDTGPTFRDSGNPKRGIMTSLDFWSLYNIVLAEEGGEYSIDETVWFGRAHIDDAIDDMYAEWSEGGWSDGFDHAQNHIIRGTHVVPVSITQGGDFTGTFLISANGLRCETINQWQETDDSRWLGFDPQAQDQTGAGRNVGDRHVHSDFGHTPAPTVLWDVVYTLDPHEVDEEYPFDTREYAQKIHRFLEKNCGVSPQALPGEYILALHSYDDTPQIESVRAGEDIPLYQNDPAGLGHRSRTSDYIEFMAPNDTTKNLGVEVEVRLGKGATATTFRFETVIPESNDDTYANVPYGIDWHTPCDPIGGPNPVGPNFAPQYIAIDVLGGSARWLGHDEIDLYPILGGGVYSYPGDTRKPLDVYIHVVPWAQPEQEDWATVVGRALYEVMEAATAGVYGQMLMHDPGGEAGCRAIFDGTSKSMLWKWDASTRALTSVPVLSYVDDYPYGMQTDEFGNEFNSPYVQELFFYYPYKIISRDACRNSIGIAITPVYGSYIFDHGQHRYYLEPEPTTDCC